MKVNDYVLITKESLLKSYKITENKPRRITKIFTDMENRLCITVEDIHSHYVNKNDLTLLTPEETLEMFKGRFEKLGYELTLYNDETIRVFKQLTDNEWDEYHKDCKECNYLDLKKSATWEFANYHIELYKESWYITSRFADDKKIPNSFIDLIREFQNWYWRDK